MSARIHDSPLRWNVDSASEAGASYLVDLGKFGGVGECQCRAFLFNCLPRIKKGETIRCRHITEARQNFLEWAVVKFREYDLEYEQDTRYTRSIGQHPLSGGVDQEPQRDLQQRGPEAL